MSEIRATDYFAIVPEFVLYADISANAVRLFAVLNRFANSQMKAWPSRKTLAEAMKVSTATIDRAKDELVEIGALTVTARISDLGDPTSNLYTLSMSRPGGPTNMPTSSPVRKGLLTLEERGLLKDDDLKRVRKNESQLGRSSLERIHGDKAGQVFGLVRLGRETDARDYIADQEPVIREWLEKVLADALSVAEGRS
jgi:hypothetical protein